ncbi:hypothetical protein VT84_35810 [Gemmata sp. SH-PL17]|uniref:DUF6985 domain-containing protein n=1 Tax=Gemmata sp. SH-PL17 TaxID=1630693 RepID=UPI0004AF8A2B|nr:ankyrin repeat domain-containing protein [Gemmata sp. SH-PL17]AMV29815.1 hypothetical protein VT84_35810 [Gemmata sp. SH-PL17]
MTHDVFGKLRFRDADESWAGSAALARFATIGVMPEPAPLTEEEAVRMAADMNAALENIKAQMRERFGDQADKAFAEIDREAEEEAEAEATEEPDPRDAEREKRRAVRREKRAALLAKGRFPFRIAGPSGTEPSPKQEAAFRFLVENESAVFDAVCEQVWQSFRSAFEQEEWRLVAGVKPAASLAELQGRFAVPRVDITYEARGGFAHLAFLIESDWQDEHGLVVVYSPDERAAHWTSWEGLYDLLESDEPEGDADEYVPTPHDLLLEAILTGDEERARELEAAGAKINELGPDEYPPLWISVDQIEVEEVRRLLAHGADPTLSNPDERSTPLRHAKRMYRDMGFSPSKNQDQLLNDMFAMIRETAGDKFNDLKVRLEEIIHLLEAAQV